VSFTIFPSVFASSSGLDWTICGCVGVITTFTCAYRTLTRRFDWGPSDT
jgi:hypothetical protein